MWVNQSPLSKGCTLRVECVVLATSSITVGACCIKEAVVGYLGSLVILKQSCGVGSI